MSAGCTTCNIYNRHTQYLQLKNVEDAHGSSHTLVVKSRPVVRRLKILGYASIHLWWSLESGPADYNWVRETRGRSPLPPPPGLTRPLACCSVLRVNAPVQPRRPSTLTLQVERENLCLMSSDVLRHIRDKLYETLNTNLREKLVGCKTVYFGLVHLCRGDPCQDLGGKLNLEIWCPSGLKICILFSSKVKIYIKMRIKTFLGPV